MSSIQQLHARVARLAARRRAPSSDADTGAWFAILQEYADRHFGGDIQACACALDERIKAQPLPDEIAALLAAMRAHCEEGFAPEEYVAALARVMRDLIAPGSLADVAPQTPPPVSSP